LYKNQTNFSSFVFLPSFEKERRKMNQKEERKTVVGRSGTQKTRSQDSARGFRDTVSPENAPASAFLASCLQKLGAKSSDVYYVCRKCGPKNQADRSVRKTGRRAPAGK